MISQEEVLLLLISGKVLLPSVFLPPRAERSRAKTAPRSIPRFWAVPIRPPESTPCTLLMVSINSSTLPSLSVTVASVMPSALTVICLFCMLWLILRTETLIPSSISWIVPSIAFKAGSWLSAKSRIAVANCSSDNTFHAKLLYSTSPSTYFVWSEFAANALKAPEKHVKSITIAINKASSLWENFLTLFCIK